MGFLQPKHGARKSRQGRTRARLTRAVGYAIEALEPRQLLSGDALHLVRDINTTPQGDPNRQFASFTSIDGTAFYTVNDGVHGTELWKSDGTPGNGTLLKDIYTGRGSSDPGSLIDFNGTLYFFATDAAHGRELWKSDGTSAGTALVKDIDASSTSSIH